MKRLARFWIPISCLVAMLGVACGPDETELAATVASDVADNVAATVSAVPTQTPFATYTAVPTYTPNPTATPWPTHTPFPTLTPLPSITPTPEPEVLFAEDFEDGRSCFQEESFDEYNSGIMDGAFHVAIRAPGYITWFGCTEEKFDDFILSVDIEVAASRNETVYGMHVRGGGSEAGWHSYEFLINSSGGVCIRYREESGNYIPLTNSVLFDGSCWIVASDYVNPSRTQRLEIAAIGEELTMSIDGHAVAIVRDVELSRGDTSFLVMVFDLDAPVEVIFDNLVVVAPE